VDGAADADGLLLLPESPAPPLGPEGPTKTREPDAPPANEVETTPPSAPELTDIGTVPASDSATDDGSTTSGPTDEVGLLDDGFAVFVDDRIGPLGVSRSAVI
jgi:hypothetical protein